MGPRYTAFNALYAGRCWSRWASCSYVVGASTIVGAYVPKSNSLSKSKYQPIFIQPSSIVADKTFPATAIIKPLDDPSIIVSNIFLRQRLSVLIIIGTSLTMIGFVVQFVGIRAIHWSVALFQLRAKRHSRWQQLLSLAPNMAKFGRPGPWLYKPLPATVQVE